MWQAALGAAADVAQDIGGKLFQNYFNKKNAKKSYERQVALQDLYYNKWRPLEQWQDYDMAQRYAENSAKWEVTGLKNAGLNPILAASSVGDLGSSYSAPSGGASSAPDIDGVDSPGVHSLLDAMNKVASTESLGEQSETTKQMRSPLVANAKEDTRIKRSEVKINEATADKIRSESDQIAANTARSLFELQRLRDSGGLKNSLLHDASLLIKDNAQKVNNAMTLEKLLPDSQRLQQIPQEIHQIPPSAKARIRRENDMEKRMQLIRSSLQKSRQHKSIITR